MPAVSRGTIPADWTALRAAYPTYNRLPKHISDYMAALNKGIPEGKPKNTPCCFQVSEALNRAGGEHRIGANSIRRRNSNLGGNFYLGAVDELEAHLASRYGQGEALHQGVSGKDRTSQMQARIAGRPGILCFRDNGLGAHTELWDGTDIVQNGAPMSNGAAMSKGYIWGQPRIIFWPVGGEDDQAEAPVWLQGWWDVWDGAQYWYHVSAQFIVRWVEKEPKGPNDIPPVSGGNEAKAQLAGDVLTITWGENGGASTVETFRGAMSGVTAMNGTSNRYAPLAMTRKTTWRK